MAKISCGHCGGHHQTVAEVRSCSLGATTGQHTVGLGQPDQAALGLPPPDSAATANRVEVELAISSAEVLAAPHPLGRSVLIGPDQPIPTSWSECPEIVVGPDVGDDVIDELHLSWLTRRRLIIRWIGSELPEPESDDRPFYELSPEMDLRSERLHFALTANTVDLRGPAISFAPLSRALVLGASLPVESPGSGSSERRGDMVLPSGEPAWVDGGPLDLELAGHGALTGGFVVPRVHLLSGRLQPLRPQTTRPEASGTSTTSLAPDQQAAVSHSRGPARILAPAGSGKTRVLTERVNHLLGDHRLSTKAVCLVAYNRRARAEMADRLSGLTETRPQAIRTLNSLALAIATGSGGFVGGTPATTIDERQVRAILSRLVPDKRRRQLNDPLEGWVDALSMARLGLRNPQEVADAYRGDLDQFPEVLDRYRRHLADNGLLDFDEQVLRAVEILCRDAQARQAARSVAPVLLIDEFQDLTPAHLLLIRLLAGPANEVFAVGDDDQTIYGYSGASPRWLVDFERYFPNAANHFLTVNYRCPPDVVKAATNLLSHNRQRVVKDIHSSDSHDSDPPTRLEPSQSVGLNVADRGDPQDNLVSRVRQLVDAGAAPADIAVLTRVNAALLPPAVFLGQAGLATTRPPGINETMLERSGSAAALAWLRLAVAPSSGLAPADLRLALRRPPRSLHPRIADWVCEQSSVRQLTRLADRLNTERDAATVLGLADDLTKLRDMAEGGPAGGGDTQALLHFVLHDIGLLGAASQLDNSQRTVRRAAHGDELAALLAVARLHDRPQSFETWLRSQLAPPSDSAATDDGFVTLATVHSTKGLEWPHVIVHDVRDGLYPHRLAEDVEEERRIFHVGITRGRQSVTITGSRPLSPFVAELADPRTEPWPEELPPASAASRRPSGTTNRSKSGTKPERAEPATAEEAALRTSLTEWRRQRSKSDSVPAYVVLNNRTLDAIAESAPTTLTELAAVPGIGPSRLDQYGDEILGIVAAEG